MVAHLHPRSRSTMSLFTTCLGISFLVVGAPHILPCPVDRRQFAEDGSGGGGGGGEARKRRRKKVAADTDGEASAVDLVAAATADDMQGLARPRECPVPRPGGLLGQVMGFKEQEKETPTVVIKSLRDKQRSGETS